MAGIIKKQILKHLSSVPCWLWWRLVCCELHNQLSEYQKSLRTLAADCLLSPGIGTFCPSVTVDPEEQQRFLQPSEDSLRI